MTMGPLLLDLPKHTLSYITVSPFPKGEEKLDNDMFWCLQLLNNNRYKQSECGTNFFLICPDLSDTNMRLVICYFSQLGMFCNIAMSENISAILLLSYLTISQTMWLYLHLLGSLLSVHLVHLPLLDIPIYLYLFVQTEPHIWQLTSPAHWQKLEALSITFALELQ